MEYLATGREMSLMDKLQVLTDAAKYDVACTSSGVERKGDGRSIGNCVAAVSATVFPVMGDAFPC